MSQPNGDGDGIERIKVNDTEAIPIDKWQSHIRVLLMDIEHCVLGLIAKGSLVIFKTLWGVLSQTLSILRNIYYDEVLKAKLHTAFEMELS